MIKSNTSGSFHGIHTLHRAHGLLVRSSRVRFAALLGLSLVAAPAMLAQGTGISKGQFPTTGGSITAPQALPSKPAITANGAIVEDIIARVNDQIITRTEYERSLDQLHQQAQQENWPASELTEREHNMLRDMIDQHLLLSKGKELGITGDAELIRQLDDMRKKANLDSMDALEKAAEQQGVSFEDFKQNIRNQVISQQVVQQEVGRRVDMSRTREEAFYKAHAQEFAQPEQVHLSEILIPTPENATDAQVSEAQTKADGVEAKLKGGANFADLAKTASGGPNASAGGDLGDFKRGALGSDLLEKATFTLDAGGITAPIRTRQGFVILRVDSHQQAGTPPMEQVESQVQQAVYLEGLQPALRAYLTKAREDAYMSPLPAGFVDSGAPKESTGEVYTAYEPPKVKKKVVKKQEAETAAATKASAQLAEARQKLAAKQTADQAAKVGVKNVSANGKQKKIKREKVRFGQAPRNALPAGTTEIANAPSLGAAAEPGTAASSVAPGAAMTNQQPGTVITAGIGTENDDPLAPQTAAPERKTRFSTRQHETNEKKAELKLASADVKANKRAQPATAEELADEKARAQPLGLKGDTTKKQPKPKRKKGQTLDRLQNQPVKAPEPPPIAPTVNPSLGAGVSTNTSKPADKKPSADTSALPPTSTDTAAPNAGPEGQPLPSVTGTNPGAPASTVPQPH